MDSCNKCGETYRPRIEEPYLSRRFGTEPFKLYIRLADTGSIICWIPLIIAPIIGLSTPIAIACAVMGTLYCLFANFHSAAYRLLVGYDVYHFTLENGEFHTHATDPRIEQIQGIQTLVRVAPAGLFRKNAYLVGKWADPTDGKRGEWVFWHDWGTQGDCRLTAECGDGQYKDLAVHVVRLVGQRHSIREMEKSLQMAELSVKRAEAARSDDLRDASKLSTLATEVIRITNEVRALKDTKYRSKHAQALRKKLEESVAFLEDHPNMAWWQERAVLPEKKEEQAVPLRPSL